MRKPIRFVEVESGICGPTGYGKLGAELGIDAIKIAGINRGSRLFIETDSLTSISIQEHYDYQRHHFDQYLYELNVSNECFARHIDYLIPVCEKIANDITNEIHAGNLPFVLAGDHSTSAGTIAGVKQAFPDKKLGVIWIDAHGDLHSPYTTPSGNLHGMPVGASLGLTKHIRFNNNVPDDIALKWHRLSHIGGICPKITMDDLVYIAIRDLEEAEWDIIKKNKIKHYRAGLDRHADTHSVNYMNNYTMQQVYESTMGHLDHCDMIYVSFDIDAVDGSIVPGTGTPVPHGLNVSQARELLSLLCEDEKLVAFEMVEVNPLLDTHNKTAKVAFDLINYLYYAEPDI